jgi:hypothetical protein
MKKLLLLALSLGLGASSLAAQITRPEGTNNTSSTQETPTDNSTARPAQSMQSTAAPSATVAKAGGVHLAAPQDRHIAMAHFVFPRQVVLGAATQQSRKIAMLQRIFALQQLTTQVGISLRLQLLTPIL